MSAKAVVFDLDNVLYNETDYFFSAFLEVAEVISKITGIKSGQVFDFISVEFKEKGSLYPRFLSHILQEYGVFSDELDEKIFSIYKNVTADLSMFNDAAQLIAFLREHGYLLGVITNGVVEAQKNKIKLLGIENLFDCILYARELGNDKEKPHPESYRRMALALGILPEEMFYIGDNPRTDFGGAHEVGAHTIRLNRGEFRNYRVGSEADCAIQNLLEVKNILGSGSVPKCAAVNNL